MMSRWQAGVPARTALAVMLGAGVLAGPATAPHGVAAPASHERVSVTLSGTGGERVAPGVEYVSFTVTTGHGQAVGHLVTADLRDPRVALNLLHPDAVAKSEPVSRMMLAQRAVAGTNGDFFNISETHPGVAPTFSSVGPEIADRAALKASVPNGQRFGPGLPKGTTTEDVFGVGADRRARVSTLDLVGRVRSRSDDFDIEGLNQYALPVNGIGVYTDEWGTASRVRATCGTDTDRAAPCTSDTAEVVVERGVVTSVATQPGAGAISGDAEVLVGREAGAAELRTLRPGDRVAVDYRLDDVNDVPPFTFAIGGFPILRGGEPLAGLNDVALAPRTSAGTSADGRTVYLVALEGRSASSVGMTVSELAGLMRSLGAADAVNLDGGGSSEIATRRPGSQQVVVRNNPSDGAERPVANGIGVFTR